MKLYFAAFAISLQLSFQTLGAPLHETILTHTEAGSQFGAAVAINNDTLVVGTELGADSTGTNFPGSVSLYGRNGNGWIFQQKITPLPGATPAGADFGSTVALSGDTLVVGFPGDRSVADNGGSVYVFVRNGSSWTQQQILRQAHPTASALFGQAVAIDGDTLVVGAIVDSTIQSLSGLAYVFVRNGTTWELQDILPHDVNQLEELGHALAIQGNTILLGANSDSEKNQIGGAVFVYVREGTQWDLQQKLFAPDSADFDLFGWSVSLSGDNAAIGAIGDDDAGQGSGSVYVFRRNAGLWDLEQKFFPTDAATNDWFGYSIALQGNNLLVGAPQNYYGGPRSGKAYLFSRGDSGWVQQEKLTGSLARAGDEYGWSVALDESTAVVGSPTHYPGLVYLYEASQPLEIHCPDPIVVSTDPGSANRSGVTWSISATDGANVSCSPASGSTFPIGTTSVTCVATRNGESVSCSFDVTVQDKELPVVRSIQATPSILFPPNNKMVPVKIQVDASDNAGTPGYRIVGVSSSEPQSANNKRQLDSDYRITGPLSLELRAERSGQERSRIYSITVECRDEAGNVATVTTDVIVPHDQRLSPAPVRH